MVAMDDDLLPIGRFARLAGLSVGALRHYRGVNETISSLLLAYIAIALMNHLVECPLRDPASLNKPSTAAIGDAYMIGNMPGTDVHWGLAVGVIACIFFAGQFFEANVLTPRLLGKTVGLHPLWILFSLTAGAALAGIVGMLVAVPVAATAGVIIGYVIRKYKESTFYCEETPAVIVLPENAP